MIKQIWNWKMAWW